MVINPWDEYAVEGALLLQEKYGGDITVLTMGGENSKEALKHALAMGAGEAVLISDPALAGADTLSTAHVLSAAIKKVGDVNLAVFGRQAIDGDMGITPYQVARILSWPSLSLVSKFEALDATAGTLKVERTVEEGKQIVESKLPAVVSVSKDIGEPRYPSFMGIRKAARATINTWSVTDLGIQAPKAVVSWPELNPPPARNVQVEMITGASPHEIAEKLADKILAEKVL
jgi:electron transfer flavoprotein beta subunit